MKKILVIICILMMINLSNIAESDAFIFNEESFVQLNETSSFSNVVIFIKFSDEESYIAPYDFDYYEDMFNGVDSNSLRDYFLEVSYNKLTIDSYLVNDNSQIVYYIDSHDRAYYQPYDGVSNPIGYLEDDQAAREHELLKSAIDYVDANNLIDDSIILDSNDDGDIDSITFMISGEDDGWNGLFWPHKWNLYTYYDFGLDEYTIDAPTINGIYAYDYTFELMGDSTSYLEIVYTGVLAHETFHLISAPDLYHYYDSLNIDPIGDWGLMGSSTFTPSHMLGYMKEYYGKWIDDVSEITESGTYSLEPLQDSEDNLYLIDLGNSNEYIYLEYRDNAGLYESNLVESGLLVYRVDLDYYDEGNVYGYYDESDLGEDEVFIFRPGIPDTIAPITFPLDDNDLLNVDGNIDQAALSDTNYADEMGMGTDIPIFYNSGELIDITISNVVEHDGYVTFDIELPLKIELDIDEVIPPGTQLLLLDNPIYEYNVSILNLPLTGDAYYTLDGSIPTTSDILYTGGLIPFNASGNIITVSIYEGETFIESSSKEFDFVASIETEHNPYRDLKNTSWYLDFKYSVSEFTLSFHNLSALEDDYDYIHIIDNGNITSYTGIEMRSLELDFSSQNLLIQFKSDDYVNEYYGIGIDISISNTVGIQLVGSSYLELNIGDTYIEEGADFSGTDFSLYSITTEGIIDSSYPGIQTVTYNLLDPDGILIESIYREVDILDVTAPIATLIGDEVITINYLDAYYEFGVSYFDNLSESLSYDASQFVDSSILGEHIIYYTVTDSYGNVSNELTRTVYVVDVEPPVLELLPSVDTIFIGEEYVIPAISITDNHTINPDVIISGTVDTSVEGETIIEYTVTDFSGNVSTITRYVNVIARVESKEFICEAGISTFEVGDEFTPPDCFVDDMLAEITFSNSNIIIKGTYEITYSITIDGILYEKESYIFVYNSEDILINYYDFKRRITL